MALDEHNDSIWNFRELKEEWKYTGQCVIVCQVKDTATLLGLAKYCEQWNVPHHLYVDEGYTEVECGTPTAFATGIVEEKDQWMFDKLRLYK
jgi:peptidyl-tRNA hydrolase